MRKTDIVKIYRRFKDDQDKRISAIEREIRDIRMLLGLIADKMNWGEEK